MVPMASSARMPMRRRERRAVTAGWAAAVGLGLYELIVSSCLGLWVLVMFSCSTRTKEMGIRKVLGASRWNLFYQLVKGFFQLILIAVVIALPVAWFSMNTWLSHYAFRTDLKAWFFIVPVLLMLFISFVTVAFQTMKIIMSKPARSLRYE